MKNHRSFLRNRFLVKPVLGAVLALGFSSPLLTAADTSLDAAAAAARQAQDLLREHHVSEAIAQLEKATALEPQSARHHADLGVALSQRLAEVSGPEQGEIAARMLREFETSVALDPGLVDGYVGLARYYTNAPEFAGGSRKRAENYATEIAKRVPWLGECEYGNIAFKFGSFDAALAHYGKADELNSGQAWIKELCARALLGLGRKDEARARLEAVLALEPGRESAKAMLTKLDADTAR